MLVYWRSGVVGEGIYGYVYNETGDVLNDEPFYHPDFLASSRAYKFDDGTWHLALGCKIYDLQTLELIHEIADCKTMPVGYKSVELDRKYCYINNDGQFVALNQDFTVFQISTPLVDTACFPRLDFLERRVVNNNNDLEWLVTEYCSGTAQITAYSGSTPFFQTQHDGSSQYPTIVMLPQYVPGIDAPKIQINDVQEDTTRVFNLLTGMEEWKHSERYHLRQYETNTAHFVRFNLGPDVSSHVVYGMDYQPVATFPKAVGLIATIHDFSTNTFDQAPNNYEILYRYFLTPPQMEIIRPNGTVVAGFDSASTSIVSRINGFSNKLLLRNTTAPFWTKVYDLPSLSVGSTAPELRFPLLMWPNPVTNSLFIDPQTFPSTSADVNIFDLLGRIVWQQHVASSEMIEVDTQGWPSGMYVVQVVSGGKTTSRTVVKQL
ncbi:MAG: T9SS type A sorting domain-containing protein [Saprospiraceae bacterium]|nr:T9SS type A sorting domain-containing protein [Saprospiraceae bacterium]